MAIEDQFQTRIMKYHITQDQLDAMLHEARNEIERIKKGDKRPTYRSQYNELNVNCSFDGLDFSYSSLCFRRFKDCSFIGANFTACNLAGARFNNCDFTRASFNAANFADASFTNSCIFSEDIENYVPPIVPDEGDIVGWKKALLVNNQYASDDSTTIIDECIVKLLIPSGTRRSSAFGRKCRAEYAEVLELQTLDGEPLDIPNYEEVVSMFDNSFIYKVGEPVKPCFYDKDRYHECSYGIHFFITRKEAVEYVW